MKKVLVVAALMFSSVATFAQHAVGSFGSVLKSSCKPTLLSTQFHKYLLSLHHEDSPIITLHLSRCTCGLL